MNKGLIALGVIVGIRVTVGILNHNKKHIVRWIKNMKQKGLKEQQLSAVVMGQGKLVLDYNTLLNEIFGIGKTPKGSTDEILGAAIEQVRLWKNSPGDDIDPATILAEMYEKPSNVHQYELDPYNEIDEIKSMIDSIEDGYLDIDDKYDNDPQMFIVEQALVRRMIQLENKIKEENANDIKRQENQVSSENG